MLLAIVARAAGRASKQRGGEVGDSRSLWQGVYEKRREDPRTRTRQERTEREGRLLAINGCYDHWQEVMPHVRAAVKDLISPVNDLSQLPRPLSQYHVVALGCPGSENGPPVLEGIWTYLRSGGVVLTTDLCLGNVLVPWLGDRLVAVGGTASEQDVTFTKTRPSHPLLAGIPESGIWRVAGGGHLIRLVDPQNFEVLLRTEEFEKPELGVLLFTRQVDRGMLVHFLSHAYAQTSDYQGAQAAAMILANVFDMATERGDEKKKKSLETSEKRWVRLRAEGSDASVFLVAGKDSSDLQLTRALAKATLAGVCDSVGDPFHKYINTDGTPILEFSLFEKGMWQVRVPTGSRNSLVLNGARLGPEWRKVDAGAKLTLFSAARGTTVPEICFVLEIPGE